MGILLLGIPVASLLGRSSIVNLSIPSGIWLNLMKYAGSIGAGTSNWPSFLNADGYIAGADPTVGINGNLGTGNLDITYYGRYIFEWTGRGSWQWTGTPAIIYSGGATVAGVGTLTGSVNNNFGFLDQTGPSVEFAVGALISGIGDNGSGKVRLTAQITNGFNNFGTGTVVQINNINGIAPGLYTLTNINANTVDITSLTWNVGTMSVIGGGPGPQSEFIVSAGLGSWAMLGPGFTTTWSQSNMILCKKADIANCRLGKQINPDLITRFQTMNPAFVRMMDLSAANNSLATNFTYRPKNTNFAFPGTAWMPAYQVGAITNGGSDAYTCANPSGSPASGILVDGEVVQGQISGVNAANNPTLALTGRSGGAKPIVQGDGYPKFIIFSGTPTIGDVIHLTITGSYIAGSPYSFNYTLTASGPHGSDTSLANLTANFTTAMNADATVQAVNISAFYNGPNILNQMLIVYNRNGQGVAPGPTTTFSYSVTGAGGGEVLSIGSIPTAAQAIGPFSNYVGGDLANTGIVTFVYSKIQDAWMLSGGGLNAGGSIEAMLELCNGANVGLWLPIPLLYTSASVTALAQLIRDNLNTNLNFAPELTNEDWNFVTAETRISISYGTSLGFSGSGSSPTSDIVWDSFFGLRYRQFMELIQTAWVATGRSRSTLYCPLTDAQVNLSNNPAFNNSFTYRLKGAALVTTNPTYNALGGLGVTAGTNYNAFPNRPVDYADGVSIAPYWQGALIGQTASTWGGTITPYTTLLQAGKDYASGNPALMASALTAIDNDARNGDLASFASGYANIETILASFDSQRSGAGMSKLGRRDYEGGCQMALGDSFSGTVSSTNNSVGYAPLSARFTALGWNTTPYGASNDIVAQQMVNLFIAWKNDATFQATVTAYFQQLTTAHPGRTVSPAWFGTTGPSIWDIWPGSIYTTPYKVYDAIAVWH